MPTLQFKGKNIIWNHHLAISYHTLDEVKELDFFAPKSKDNDNLLIEGDNLTALKALLPNYTGKIDCIYIDPPYNTGNEGWVYNDKVNSPLINEWIGKAVGLNDLTRHDKWLCMISPRLKILHDLLADDGVIFISIDENEFHHLVCILNEIFGEDNYIANYIHKNNSSKNQAKLVSVSTEYLLCYAKNKEQLKGKEWRIEKKGAADIDRLFRKLKEEGKSLDEIDVEIKEMYRKPKYSHLSRWNKIDENGVFKDADLSREGGPKDFTIINPTTKKPCAIPGRGWGKSKDELLRLQKEGLIWYGDDDTPPGLKDYITSEDTSVPDNFLFFDSSVDTRWFRKEFGELIFENAKPIEMMKFIIQMASDEDSIILDSFAGSGTTGHAVLTLNKELGSNRKFILVQMPENTQAEPKKNICKDITRERIKKAIDKYDYKSGFKYLRVGIPLDAESMLDGKLPTYQQFAKYVYYLCTGENLADTKAINEKKYFVGKSGSAVIYLVYKQNYEELTRLALNLTLAEQIKKDYPKKKVIVYAPACFLDEEYLDENQIQFVSIPYNLFQRNN